MKAAEPRSQEAEHIVEDSKNHLVESQWRTDLLAFVPTKGHDAYGSHCHPKHALIAPPAGPSKPNILGRTGSCYSNSGIEFLVLLALAGRLPSCR